jgi:truncated hemoglobin YjbI
MEIVIELAIAATLLGLGLWGYANLRKRCGNQSSAPRDPSELRDRINRLEGLAKNADALLILHSQRLDEADTWAVQLESALGTVADEQEQLRQGQRQAFLQNHADPRANRPQQPLPAAEMTYTRQPAPQQPQRDLPWVGSYNSAQPVPPAHPLDREIQAALGVPQQTQGVYIDARPGNIGTQDHFRPQPGDNEILAKGPSVRGDSVRDWVQHYSPSGWDWPQVVREFYRRAKEIDAVADYFNGVNLETLQQHFTRVVVKLTQSEHLTRGDVRYLAWVHRNVRNSHGEFITHAVFDATINLLAQVLDEAGVPDKAIDELARMVEPLRDVLVVPSGPIPVVKPEGDGSSGSNGGRAGERDDR